MKNTEIKDILISWLTISLAFAILLSRDFLNLMTFIYAFPLALVTVGTGFVLHEMAHRVVATHFGKKAEFRAWKFGLIFAILSAFLGFIFAAPGAVYIFGNVTRKQSGMISVAGPLTNIAVAIFFGLIAMANLLDIVRVAGLMGFQINMFLAMFNMIPFGPLDGKKVFLWSKTAWVITFAMSFAGAFLLYGFL